MDDRLNLNPYDVMFLGLSFDIAGGVALASGFILKGFHEVLRESRSTYGYNRPLLRSQLTQRGDACAGALLLAFGFVLQMYAYFHGGLTTKQYGYIDRPTHLVAVFVVVIAPLAIALVLGARWLALRSLAQFENQLRDPTASDFAPRAGDKGYLDTLALEIGTQRLPGETDEMMAARMTKIRAEKGPS